MSQSKGELNSDKQILYLVQWFAEFSEFQRHDFLADHLFPVYDGFFQTNLFQTETVDESTTNGTAATNEIIDPDADAANVASKGLSLLNLESGDRPPSIFQCRMKLFKEWFQDQWSDQDRVEFLLRLKNVDSDFVMDFYRRLLQQHQLLNRDRFVSLMAADNSVGQALADRLDLLNPLIFELPVATAPPADLTQNGFGSHPDAKRQPDLLANCGAANNSSSPGSSIPPESLDHQQEGTEAESSSSRGQPAPDEQPEVFIESIPEFETPNMAITPNAAPDLLA